MKNNNNRYLWLDITRGLAILWIFLVHFVERFLCCPAFGNPGKNWPPVIDRFLQLTPLDIDGLGGFAINIMRYIGWMGDQGVQIFLVASGFGLAISSLSKSSEISCKEFYKKRLLRILPLWIAAHLMFIIVHLLFQKGLSPLDWRTWASLFGLRSLPEVFYFGFPAWWYIGLLLQLYLIFPFIFDFLKRWKIKKFILVFIGLPILIRLIGLFIFNDYLDWWSRGGIFITRLPEFAFGMAFAKWFLHASDKQKQELRKPSGIACVLSLYLVGNLCSFFLTGMAFAFLLTGAGFFVLVYIFFSNLEAPLFSPLSWAGQRSYSLYLIHHPILIFLVPRSLSAENIKTVFLYFIITLLLSIFSASIFENVSNKLFDLNRNFYRRSGFIRLAAYWAFTAIVSIGIILGAEFLVRKFDPQEVLGWGERASLAPHKEFGYYLKPNQTTRLRWLSYDYTVEANALGFPGKLYDELKPKGTFRIFVTGDAYSSAEGVNTNDAWPRLLETSLMNSGINAQVMNFSITGWGPNQYAKVVARYAPVYKPDLIVISFFVNEFDDVAVSNDAFQDSIGFNRLPQSSLKSYLRLTHLRVWIKKNVSDQVKEIVLGKSNPHGYFFGFFRALEKKQFPIMQTNAAYVQKRLATINKVASTLGAKLLIILVPAPAQVCDPNSVKYWPKDIDLTNSDIFDLEQPQSLTKKLLNGLKIDYVDLLAPLRDAEKAKPCQPYNLHWTESGHKIVADYISQYLIQNEYFNQLTSPNIAAIESN